MQDDERGSDTGADSGCAADEKIHKKFTFKKRSTSSTGHVNIRINIVTIYLTLSLFLTDYGKANGGL